MPSSRFNFGCGGRIRTDDLRVMSPPSYHCSTPQLHVTITDLHCQQLSFHPLLTLGILEIDLPVNSEAVPTKNVSTCQQRQQILAPGTSGSAPALSAPADSDTGPHSQGKALALALYGWGRQARMPACKLGRSRRQR